MWTFFVFFLEFFFKFEIISRQKRKKEKNKNKIQINLILAFKTFTNRRENIYFSVPFVLNANEGDPWVAQWFSATFSLGCDPGDPGSSPTLGSLHGAYFSLSLSFSLP